MTAVPLFVLLIFALRWASAEASKLNSRVDRMNARLNIIIKTYRS